MIADKGYDSDAIRDDLVARNVEAVIPMRRCRKVQTPIDGTVYSLMKLIERCFRVARRMSFTICSGVPARVSDFCLICASPKSYDEPEILTSSSHPICLKGPPPDNKALAKRRPSLFGCQSPQKWGHYSTSIHSLRGPFVFSRSSIWRRRVARAWLAADSAPFRNWHSLRVA